MKNKTIKSLVLGAVSLIALVSCGKTTKRDHLIFYVWGDNTELASYEKIARDYEAETGIKVEVQLATGNYYENLNISFSSKDQAPDIFFTESGEFLSHLASNKIMNLEPYIQSGALDVKTNSNSDGKIEQFILEQCKKIDIEIDKTSLNTTYRNEKQICDFANSIYPEYPPCNFVEKGTTGHDGVFFIEPSELAEYLDKYDPIQLRDKVNVKVNNNYRVMNFGEAKGLSFDRTVIYPTKPMLEWIQNHSKEVAASSRSKLYVAITRARYSVAIVFENKKNICIDGIKNYQKDC